MNFIQLRLHRPLLGLFDFLNLLAVHFRQFHCFGLRSFQNCGGFSFRIRDDTI
jgi:hypothetical protein